MEVPGGNGSVVEGPFDAALLQHVCGGDAERPRRARRALEGRCLLQRYGPEQWRVHPLIAAYCDERMERGRLAAMHAAVAEYYGSHVVPGLRRGRPELLDDETYAVAARACRHYQWAGDHVHAARLPRSRRGCGGPWWPSADAPVGQARRPVARPQHDDSVSPLYPDRPPVDTEIRGRCGVETTGGM